MDKLGTASRFAVLKDDQPDRSLKAKQNASNLVKNNNTSKVKPQGGGGNKAKKTGKKNASKKPSGTSAHPLSDADWEHRDRTFVESQFENDLKEALLQSNVSNDDQRRQAELEGKDLADALRESQLTASSSETSSLKKLNSKGAVTMSLDEFQDDATDNVGGGDSAMVAAGPTISKKKPREKTHSMSGASAKTRRVMQFDFLDEVEMEAKKIVAAEKRADASQHDGPLESAIVLMYKSKLELAQQTLEDLTETNDGLQEEIRVLSEDGEKKALRIKRLCKTLGAAAMKDKAELHDNYEKISRVKDELTEMVAQLTGEVEKCHSRIHQLENDLKKQSNDKK